MSAPVWEPLDAAEKALKDAFTGLDDAATKVIVQGVVDAPNRFILHTKGYYGKSSSRDCGVVLPGLQ